METYLQVDHIAKAYGDIVLFEGLAFSVMEEEKTALIARNGAGKSTILKIIAGNESPDEGQVIFKNNLTVGYLPQEPQLNPEHTIIQAAFESENEMIQAVKNYENALAGEDSEAIQRAMEQMERLEAWDFEVEVRQILTQLSINQYDKPVRNLSGGERKRIALAHVLLKKPDVLILDEPTNHLDLAMIEWLEDYLKQVHATLLMVTHDRYFLDRVCTSILELDDNTVYRYNGNYEHFLTKRQERVETFNANTQKARSLLKKEEEWVKRMPKARGTKAKYRIENYEKLKERAGQEKSEEQLHLNFKARRLGKKVVNAHHLSKGFDNQMLIQDFDYKFTPGEKVGIVGSNGSGKSTLLNLLTAEVPPDEGTLEIGETVVFGYYKQEGITIDPNQRLIEYVQDIAEHVTLGDNKQMPIAQFLEYFLFPKKMHYNYVYKLSGGEKRRLYLISVLIRNPNFLILDEPTNDLDILTLNVLEDYLAKFPGCVLIVSHDRYFMDKVVDKLFVFEGKGHIKEFPGNYSIYRTKPQQESRKKAPGADTAPKNKKPRKQRPAKNFRYKHKIELEQVEQELKALETEKQEIEGQLNSGTLSDQKLDEKSRRFKEVMDALEEKEMKWLELNELKEQDEKS